MNGFLNLAARYQSIGEGSEERFVSLLFSSGYDPPSPRGRTRRTSALVTALPRSSFGPDVHVHGALSFFL